MPALGSGGYLQEGTGLYLGMFLGLVSPAVVAVVTVFTSKNNALINDFKKKLIGFYRIKPKYILIAVLIFAVIVTASIGTSVLFGGSINQFSFIFHLFINIMQEKINMTPETKCIQTIFVVIAAIIIVVINKEMFFETKHVGNLLEEKIMNREIN